MPALLRAAVLFFLLSSPAVAQVAVFWQPGFPTVASQPVNRATLSAVLDPVFLDLEALEAPGALERAELLVLPYGSSVPTDGWKAIEAYLQQGGNLLVLGGQPLRVPVTEVGAEFVQGRAQDTYSRVLDLRHTYEVPVVADAHFAWKPGYAFASRPTLQGEKFFTVQGHLNEADGHWHPHVMFFVPRATAASWGANVQGSPIMAQEGDDTSPETIFFIPVRKWSDGTPGPGLALTH